MSQIGFDTRHKRNGNVIAHVLMHKHCSTCISVCSLFLPYISCFSYPQLGNAWNEVLFIPDWHLFFSCSHDALARVILKRDSRRKCYPLCHLWIHFFCILHCMRKRIRRLSFHQELFLCSPKHKKKHTRMAVKYIVTWEARLICLWSCSSWSMSPDHKQLQTASLYA